jgi:hypothetical protein
MQRESLAAMDEAAALRFHAPGILTDELECIHANRGDYSALRMNGSLLSNDS